MHVCNRKDTGSPLGSACDVNASGVIVFLLSTPRQMSTQCHFVEIHSSIDAVLIQPEI